MMTSTTSSGEPMPVEVTRRVRVVAHKGRPMSSAQFLEHALGIHLQPWQRQICDWMDQPPS